MEHLRDVAIHYRELYRSGLCAREVAIEKIQPYLDMVNYKSKELAKKYGQTYKKITFITYVR
jgi:hypothetical protein